jgi:hypothetical protein
VRPAGETDIKLSCLQDDLRPVQYVELISTVPKGYGKWTCSFGAGGVTAVAIEDENCLRVRIYVNSYHHDLSTN